jgi:hypothetical protein
MIACFEARKIYGRELFFPLCETSTRFTRLCGGKTLTREQLKLVRELGFTLDIIVPTPAAI